MIRSLIRRVLGRGPKAEVAPTALLPGPGAEPAGAPDPARRDVLSALGLGSLLLGAAATAEKASAAQTSAQAESRGRQKTLGLGSLCLRAGDVGPDTDEDYEHRRNSYGYFDVDPDLLLAEWKAARKAQRTLSVEVPCNGILGHMIFHSDDPTAFVVSRVCIAGEEHVLGQPAPPPRVPLIIRPGGMPSGLHHELDYSFNQRVFKGDVVLVELGNIDSSGHVATVGFSFEIDP